jgi:hypothetical protein
MAPGLELRVVSSARPERPSSNPEGLSPDTTSPLTPAQHARTLTYPVRRGPALDPN